jgi:hypothetical protein
LVFRIGDPKINRAGRPRGAKTQNKRSKLRSIEIQLEAVTPEAVQVAAGLMHTAIKEENRLRAAVFIVDSYARFHEKALTEEMARNNGASSEDEPDIQDGGNSVVGSVLSLEVISSE